MQGLTEVVDLLEDKFKLLIERYDFLEEENEVLRKSLAETMLDLDAKSKILEENTSELNALRIAKTIQGSSDNTKETTKKINTLIKEVDLCIAQLSD